jgi:hypothetical protein
LTKSFTNIIIGRFLWVIGFQIRFERIDGSARFDAFR